MLDKMIDQYNEELSIYHPFTKIRHLDCTHVWPTLPCTVAGFMVGSYGKYPEDPNQIVMEYSQFTKLLVNYLPQQLNNDKFKAFMYGELPG